MSHLFRSETMGYYNLVMPRESAWEILDEIGSHGSLHFVDQDPNNPHTNRPFSQQVKRCDEVAVRLDIIQQEMKNFDRKIEDVDDVDKLLKTDFQLIQTRFPNKTGQKIFDAIEDETDENFRKLQEQLQQYKSLMDQKNQQLQDKVVIELAVKAMKIEFFTQSRQIAQDDFKAADLDIEGLKHIKGGQAKLLNLVGSIDAQDAQRFKRMVFRASKGNCFTHFQDFIQEDYDFFDGKTQNVKKEKMAYIIIFPGIGMEHFENKVRRIIDSFNAHVVTMPDSQQGYAEQSNSQQVRISDLQGTIKNTEKLIKELMQHYSRRLPGGTCSYVNVINQYVNKEKNIYFTLNLLKNQGSILTCNVWCPQAKETAIMGVIQDIHKKNPNIGSSQLMEAKQSSKQVPPTYFRTNEFTGVFQSIIDTYGVPRYKEVNPALYAIVTFPFLYGVMYGDMGHGGLLFFFGLYLSFFASSIKKDKKDALNAFLPLRYFLLLCGLFALFCGFIYNDYLAMSLNLFGSCYPVTGEEEVGATIPKNAGCVYPFGLDPVWKQTTNELVFVNSFKMKLSVILGIVQMMFGIMLKGVNAVHFKSKTDFFFEFIPQFLFLGCTFFFMDFMIFWKWASDWSPPNEAKAPFIINIMINFLIKLGEVCEESADGTLGSPLLLTCDGEKTLNQLCVVIAVIMIPIMLLFKPFILNSQHKKKAQTAAYRKNSNNINDKQPLIELEQNLEAVQGQDKQVAVDNDDEGEEEHGLADFLIHQIIETIEFVLGSISNTASYLRLWALSLAHSQLAHVILSMLVQKGIEAGSWYMAIVYFYAFAIATFGILLVMDLMECQLHTLRLHWVEFQNKFYKADGYCYEPFSFNRHINSCINAD